MRLNEDYIKPGLFGANQVGKTTWMLEQARQIYNTRNGDKVIFYTDQNPPALEGIHRLNNIDQLKKFKHGIIKYFDYKDPMKGLSDMMNLCYTGNFNGGTDVGGALILDDCKNYCKTQNEGAVTRFMANHRTYFWDLWFVAHDYKQMPLYIRERLEAYVTFKVMMDINQKELEALGYLHSAGLYKAYMEVMLDPDMRAKRWVNVKDFFKDLRDKIANNV